MTGSLDLLLCGDILPVRPLDRLSAANQGVFDAIARADVSVGNFEMPVTDRGAPVQKLLNVRAPTTLAPTLDRLRLTVVTLANNHAPDFGWDGLEDTRRALEAAGIATVGTGADLDAASRPFLVTANAVRVGVLAFSCLTPTGAGAAPSRPGISPLHVVTGYEIDPWYTLTPGEFGFHRAFVVIQLAHVGSGSEPGGSGLFSEADASADEQRGSSADERAASSGRRLVGATCL